MALALTPHADASEQRGCPDNALCIYPQNAYWNNNHPSYIFHPDYATYDDHEEWNLHNQFGIHKVFNNADPTYGDIYNTVWLNRYYDGAGPVLHAIAAGKSYDLDLTKVNSVTRWWTQITTTG